MLALHVRLSVIQFGVATRRAPGLSFAVDRVLHQRQAQQVSYFQALWKSILLLVIVIVIVDLLLIPPDARLGRETGRRALLVLDRPGELLGERLQEGGRDLIVVLGEDMPRETCERGGSLASCASSADLPSSRAARCTAVLRVAGWVTAQHARVHLSLRLLHPRLDGVVHRIEQLLVVVVECEEVERETCAASTSQWRDFDCEFDGRENVPM